MNNKSWFPIFLIYACGLAGTSALGMMGPLAADIGGFFNVPAATVGLAIAGQLLPLAFAGLVMGWLIDRLGPRPLLLLGLLTMGGCSLTNAWLDSFALLRGTLLLQGIALVALLTSGQGLLMMFTAGRQQVQAMTLWSTVMPVGYALGLLAASPFAGSEDWQRAFTWHSGVTLALLVTAPWLPALRAGSSGGGVWAVVRNSRVVRFGMSLSLSALAGIGSSAVGALYFNRVHGLELSTSAQMMAVASVCGVAGSIVIGVLLNRGWPGNRLAMLILLTATLGAAAFYWPSDVLVLAVAGAVLQQLCVGGFIALVYSLLPRALPEPGMAGSAAGLVGQITGIGATFSAPLFFGVLDMNQWHFFVLISVVAWGCGYLLLPSERDASAVAASNH